MIIAIPTNNAANFNEIPKRSQNAAYCKYVDAAGYTPILVPMEADPVQIAEMADGLLLAGGIDIDPMHYGFGNMCSYSVDPEKDASERALFHAFKEFHKPIFGICRGFQLIFRELLHTHEDRKEYNDFFEYMENVGEHAQTGSLSVPRRFPSHPVKANVPELFGVPAEQLPDGNPFQMVPVNSMHHQCVGFNYANLVDENAPELKAEPGYNAKEPALVEVNDVEVLAWSMRGIKQPTKSKGNSYVADFDNYWTIAEAVKIHNWGGPIMGVQWHPEELGDIRILRNFFGDGEANNEPLAGNA